MPRGCFVWTLTSPLAGRRTPRLGPMRVCVCSSFLAGSGRLASRARFGAPHLFIWLLCLSALLGPLQGTVAPFFRPLFALTSPLLLLFCCFFLSFSFVSSFLPCATSVSCFLVVSGPGCPRPWRFALFVLLASRFLALRALSLSLCCLAVGRSPVVAPPRASLSCCCCRSLLHPALFFFFPYYSSRRRPPCLRLSVFSGPGCPGPWRLCVSAVPGFPCSGFLFFFCLPPPGSSCALARFVSPGWPVVVPGWLLPTSRLLFCVSRLSSFPLGALVFFLLFCAPPLSLVCGPWCRGPWRCVLFVFLDLPLPCSPCALASCVSPAWPLAAPWWLPPLPTSLLVSRGLRRCRSVLCAVCCAVLCVPACVAAPRCCALCRPMLCCRVLCCSVALVWCRRLLRRALWRCPSPCGPVLCGAVLCGVSPRCVLCAACVLSWNGGACCCLPLCFVLCVSRGAVLCVPCPLRSVRCCPSLCWCACVVLFVLCVPLLAPGFCGALLCVVLFSLVCCGAVLGLVARGCLLVVCFGVGVPVWPRGLLPCGWRGLLWCPASLCHVLWCCAFAWCCAVVLCCRVVVLLGLALPSCGLSCCAVLCCWLAVLFFPRWWCLRAVVLFPPCCAFPVFSRSVRCAALLCWLWCLASLCRVLWRCAVV